MGGVRRDWPGGVPGGIDVIKGLVMEEIEGESKNNLPGRLMEKGLGNW